MHWGAEIGEKFIKKGKNKYKSVLRARKLLASEEGKGETESLSLCPKTLSSLSLSKLFFSSLSFRFHSRFSLFIFFLSPSSICNQQYNTRSVSLLPLFFPFPVFAALLSSFTFFDMNGSLPFGACVFFFSLSLVILNFLFLTALVCEKTGKCFSIQFGGFGCTESSIRWHC